MKEIWTILTALGTLSAVIIALILPFLIDYVKNEKKYHLIRRNILDIFRHNDQSIVGEVFTSYILSLSNNDMVKSLYCNGWKDNNSFNIYFGYNKEEISISGSYKNNEHKCMSTVLEDTVYIDEGIDNITSKIIVDRLNKLQSFIHRIFYKDDKIEGGTVTFGLDEETALLIKKLGINNKEFNILANEAIIKAAHEHNLI